MNELFFGGGAAWFTIAAFVGTFFFLVRLALTFVGGDADLDGGADSLDVEHGDSDAAFKFLSIQSVTAFLMGFGWGGLGGLKGLGWSAVSSVAGGVAFGVGVVWLQIKLLKFVYDLQSTGTVNIQQAIGLEGSVYVGVPAVGSGRGKVRIVIGDRERFFTAVSDGEAIDSRTAVRVVDVNSDNTLTVTKLFREELPQ